jgi:hypothetical protein
MCCNSNHSVPEQCPTLLCSICLFDIFVNCWVFVNVLHFSVSR